MTVTNTNLNERAMLVDLSIGFWEGRQKNKQISQQTLETAHAEKGAGAWWTRILPPHLFRRVLSALERGRADHIRLTLPWSDRGVRILPSQGYLDYTKVLREAKVEFEAAVEEFCQEYPEAVAGAGKRLGDLYEPERFPKVSQIHSKFHWTLRVYPLPTTADFRVDIGDEETKRVKEEMEVQLNQALKEALEDVWQRIHDVLSKVVERLSDPEKIFRDSLIGHVVELCDLLPKLNVSENPDLERMRQEIVKEVTKAKPDDLRHEPIMREKVAKSAADILKKMSGFYKKELPSV